MKHVNKRIAALMLMLFFISCATNAGSVPYTVTSTVTNEYTPTLSPSATASISPTGTPALTQSVNILVDDFEPQPLQGTAFWPSNRLNGERGKISNEPQPSDAKIDWGKGVVTATLTPGSNIAGVWTSLSHLINDCQPINFSAIFPPQIEPQYQGRIAAVQIQVLDGHGTFHVELKLGKKPYCDYSTQDVIDAKEFTLGGGPQTLIYNLPMGTGEITNLNWYVSGDAGDFVSVSRVELVADVPQLTTARQAFLWNYVQLLSLWSPDSGLTRDQGYFSAGQFDNLSASGLQAAAAVMAYRLGFISKNSAVDIVYKTSQGMVNIRSDDCEGSGLWPHFVTKGLVPENTEWSSIDTVVAAVSMIESEQALGLDTTPVEQVLKGIDWKKLTLPDGHISHGYWYKNPGCVSIEPDGEGGWQDFGTESWIVNLGEAASTGDTADFQTSPPTANGGGFIDELAWLFMPTPERDHWGIEWKSYSQQAVDRQLNYYQCQAAEAGRCCNGESTCLERDARAGCPCCRENTCFGKLGLFGLSPAEAPDLSIFPPNSKKYYLDFGVCGSRTCYDGTGPLSAGNGPSSKITLGHAVIVPYYAGMIAALRPAQAMNEWNWLVSNTLETPLNTAESFMFTDEGSGGSDATCSNIVWNARKGGWELGLATLGWARYLVGNDNPLYQGFQDNSMLAHGYQVMLEP